MDGTIDCRGQVAVHWRFLKLRTGEPSQLLAEGPASVIVELSGVTSVLSVEVQPTPPAPDELVGLRFSPDSVDCNLAQTADFTVIAEFGDGSTEDVTDSNETLYASSDNSVALVVQGQVLCVQPGQATVQATFGGRTASVVVSVF